MIFCISHSNSVSRAMKWKNTCWHKKQNLCNNEPSFTVTESVDTLVIWDSQKSQLAEVVVILILLTGSKVSFSKIISLF
jgi:hypothetical protein